MIRLLAMSPSGESFFTRDHDGTFWQQWRLGLDFCRQATESEVNAAVLEHGFERVDLDFETWEEARDVFLRRVRRAPGPVVVTCATARALVPVLEKWGASPDDCHRVPLLVDRLLEVEEVRDDPWLVRTFRDLLIRASQHDRSCYHYFYATVRLEPER